MLALRFRAAPGACERDSIGAEIPRTIQSRHAAAVHLLSSLHLQSTRHVSPRWAMDQALGGIVRTTVSPGVTTIDCETGPRGVAIGSAWNFSSRVPRRT
jgi:hypothetical protein